MCDPSTVPSASIHVRILFPQQPSEVGLYYSHFCRTVEIPGVEAPLHGSSWKSQAVMWRPPSKAAVLSIPAHFAALPKEKGAERARTWTPPHSDQWGVAGGASHSQSSPCCLSTRRVALESPGGRGEVGLWSETDVRLICSSALHKLGGLVPCTQFSEPLVPLRGSWHQPHGAFCGD